MKTGRLRNRLPCLLVLVLVPFGLLSIFYTYNSKLRAIKKPSLQYAEVVTIIKKSGLQVNQPQENQPEPQKKTQTQRKIFLDCGANVASSVQFFRETYPDGKNFIIHSFEIDERLAPYFKPYSNHVLHCPVGVTSQNGSMTAYTESAWSPNKGKNNGIDMQWGGGTLYVDRFEKADITTGGKRKLSHRRRIPTIDLSMWIQTNTRIEDYVILKLDVEGAEFEIFKKMLKDGTFKWIDKLYGEYHFHQPIEMAASTKRSIMYEVEKRAMKLKQWGAEYRTYSDFGELHPIKVPPGTSGKPGVVYSICTAGDKRQKVAIAIEVGMNRKLAEKVIATVMAYKPEIPVTLFVYGDFVEEYPSLVESWASRFEIGIRGNHPYPHGHAEMIMGNWIKEAGISAELRLEEIGVVTRFYMPPCDVTDIIRGQGRHREWRIIKPSSSFPPTYEPLLTVAKYYKYRDVERVPKALRMINDQLVTSKGGVLSLNTDHPDSYMIIVFLLDYLVENSGYELVTMEDCISEV
ncbi:uncharacterized protein LOC117123469 [Anneissia japonica]|uniref:uncharacterized protein LOC117123469 n=1 Tax=Anneissia japonica TaxID=1529436 RepID=UPI0014257ED5|nr:uncharacterized protein LOC117123469 [Anneissia japonica]XP_033125284.1 uncharacterized protein LOC117123469 [Anneissia japonica]